MSRRIGLSLVLLVACRPAPAERAPAADATGQPLAAEDIAAVRATDSAFASAMNAGDAAGMAVNYLPDAHLLPPDAPPVEGREAVLKFFVGLLSAYQVTVAVGADEIEGRGDLAYARGHYTLEGTPKAAGAPPIHEEGKFLEILRRQSDGRWRYAVDMYSPNHPAPAGK
jgi:uncharacterized protein (TIGR02246 family)